LDRARFGINGDTVSIGGKGDRPRNLGILDTEPSKRVSNGPRFSFCSHIHWRSRVLMIVKSGTKTTTGLMVASQLVGADRFAAIR
jgi:hypothetical protein